MAQRVGAIDFREGVLKTFNCRYFFRYWNAIGYVPKELHSKTIDWKYRVCAEGGGSVYVVDTGDMIFYCLCLATKQWEKGIQIDTTHRTQCAAMAYCKGRLYISGGESFNGHRTYNTVLSLVVKEDKMPMIRVQKEPHLLYRRCEHKMACLDGKVVVCGGRKGNSTVTTCEIFYPSTHSWVQISPLPEPRRNFGLGLVSTANGMYVLGGVTGYNATNWKYDLSDAVSFYDRQTQQWTSSTNLPLPLGNIQGIYKGGSLWVLATTMAMRPRLIHDPNTTERVCFYRVGNILEYNVTQQNLAHI